MDNATTMIVCQSCKGRLRVPTDQGSLRLTCPVCRASWDWIPPNTFTDERVLPFRCAQTGQQFFVVFGRQSSMQRFRVLNVRDQMALAGELSEPDRDSPHVLSQAAQRVETFEAADFDFAGWFCPGCGYGQTGEMAIPFVRCSICGECVCGGRIIQIPGGPATFACRDGCGGGGRVEGRIASFDGMTFEEPSSRLLPPSNRARLALQGDAASTTREIKPK